MRRIAACIASALFLGLLANVALAHGGTYTGPQGGGTPGPSAPVGGGTGPGQPNPNNPNPGGGGVTGGGVAGGSTPNPGGGGAPVRPGVGRGVGRGSARGGGVTGRGKPKSKTVRHLSWDWWWDLNEERFLNLKEKLADDGNASDNRDAIVGDPVDDDIAPVTRKIRRQKILPSLKFALKDPFFDARAAAVIALGKVGDAKQRELVDDIAALLQDSHKQVRESACLGLGLLGSPEAVPMLLEIAQDTPKARAMTGRSEILPRTRAFASVAVGLIGARTELDAAVIDVLLKLCSTKAANRDVQVGPAIALQLLGQKALAPQLLSVVQDPEQPRSVRAHVALALGKGDAKSTVNVHVANLDHKINHLQYSSAISLGLLVAPDDHATIRKLIRHAESARDRGTRNFCIMALGEIGGPKARGFLMTLAKTAKQEHDRSFGCLALGVTGYKHQEERREMGRVVLDLYRRSRSRQAKSPMAIALGLLAYQPAREVLRADLEGPGGPELKGHLCTALGLMNDRDSVPAIRELVKRKGDPDLRKRAAIALGLLHDRTAISLLKSVMESTGSKAILGAATVALGYVGDRDAVPTLVDFVERRQDHADLSRAFAVVALGFLGDKDDIPLLSRIHEHSNYLTQTEALGELLTIL